MVSLVRRVTPAIRPAAILVAGLFSGLLALSQVSPALAHTRHTAQADAITKTTVSMELRQGGVVHVKEQLTYTGAAPTRTLVTRTRYDDTHDRLYRVTGLKGDGRLDGDIIKVTGKGTATLEYDVAGVVTPSANGEELLWYAVSGWSAPVTEATVTVTAVAQLQNLSCFAGELTSAVGCTTAEMDHTGTVATFSQQGLPAGQALTVVVGYPKGASGGAPILDRRFELAAAFSLTPLTVGALVLLLILLLGGVGLLYWTRGRDARATQHESQTPSPLRGGDFEPPDGVRPGQIGTLYDEQADVIDVTASIVDLAVRGYLLIDEQPRRTYDAPDWRLIKRPGAPIDALMPYERALYDALFDGRDAVLLSELHGTFGAGLDSVRDALYRDVVTQGWFAHRPDAVRTKWTTIGVIVAVAGVVATGVLAWLTTYGLIGLALIIAGAALAVGGQFMPAKTGKGAAALAHAMGMREHLAAPRVDNVPADRRVEVFSRYLPYAMVFDSVDPWARLVASVTANGGPADNLYWYNGPAEWDLSKFADSMRIFTDATSGALSAARRLR